MTTRQPQRKPTFLWQGVLILVPVVVLVAVGLWTLRQDRAAMEQEARGRAEPIAAATLAGLKQHVQQIVRGVRDGTLVTLTRGALWFEVQPDNSLGQLWPFTWPPTPAPFPTNLVDLLNPERAQLWHEAGAAYSTGGWGQAIDLYSAFATNGGIVKQDFEHAGLTSERLRGEAYLRIAAAQLQLSQTNLAVEAYDSVLRSFTHGSDTRSEAGVPLTHLAALRILDLSRNPGELPRWWDTNFFAVFNLLSSDCSPFGNELALRLRALLQPTTQDLAIPPHLLNATEARKQAWRETREAAHKVTERAEIENWLRSQEIWRLYHEAADLFPRAAAAWPERFWVDGNYRWLAVLQKRSASETALGPRVFAAFPKAQLDEEIRRITNQADPLGLFAVKVSIQGRVFAARQTEGTNWKYREVSSTADAPEDSISVAVTLADPAAFFGAQRQRQLWFGGLMLAAAVACVLAFASTWRAYRRQLSLNEQKSNFVSSVSHELRAPIASVRLLAESLERGKVSEPAKQNEYFRFIGQECRRLSALIENVLDFSRIEQGRKQYEFEPTDIVALAEQTVKLMEPYAAERGVKLALETSNTQHPTCNLELNVDGRAIQQALVNLIDNAIKHSPKGQMVTVGLTPVTSHLTLSVTDRGPGIPASEHEKIFQRFYRLGSELRRETQGVGIGLSIVKHIVEAHGGRVRVESEVGKGSRFTIQLQMK